MEMLDFIVPGKWSSVCGLTAQHHSQLQIWDDLPMTLAMICCLWQHQGGTWKIY